MRILAPDGARVRCVNAQCKRWFKARAANPDGDPGAAQRPEGFRGVLCELPSGWVDGWDTGYAAIACSDKCLNVWAAENDDITDADLDAARKERE